MLVSTLSEAEYAKDYSRWEYQVSFGSQSYLGFGKHDFTPDPKNAPMVGIRSSYRIGKSFVYGFDYGLAFRNRTVVTTTRDLELTKKSSPIQSLLVNVGHRLLPDEKIHPEIGLGMGFSSSIPDYDKGMKAAYTLCAGLLIDITYHTGLRLEFRRLGWKQDGVEDFIENLIDEDISKSDWFSSNQLTLGFILVPRDTR